MHQSNHDQRFTTVKNLDTSWAIGIVFLVVAYRRHPYLHFTSPPHTTQQAIYTCSHAYIHLIYTYIYIHTYTYTRGKYITLHLYFPIIIFTVCCCTSHSLLYVSDSQIQSPSERWHSTSSDQL